MLAANLRVAVAPSPDEKPSGGADSGSDKSCPLLFARDLAARVECGPADNTITASMDWLRRLDQVLNPVIRASLYRQSLDKSSQFAQQLVLNELNLVGSVLGPSMGESFKLLPGPKTSKSDEALKTAKEALKQQHCPSDSVATGDPTQDLVCDLARRVADSNTGSLVSQRNPPPLRET